MGYVFEEELLMLLPGLISGIPSTLFGLATYVLSALAIYTVSRRRGLRKAWLAWIPVVNCWLLGSLSDQYQYVVKGENKSKRKWLLGLSAASAAVWVVTFSAAIIMAGRLIVSSRADIFAPAMTILGTIMPLFGLYIAFLVIRYMALYDVFRSLDPSNAVLFLVLSLLFRPTEAFFLFFNRDKDNGMPPRRQAQAETYQEPVQEIWETESKDYL